ncbi:hypothetical protein P692DRAFT_20141740 [Suillus brevipes Sb2]|nr:hypothetical protein P692DRAFT_20141740 [Suillus brevipes Sb2]
MRRVRLVIVGTDREDNAGLCGCSRSPKAQLCALCNHRWNTVLYKAGQGQVKISIGVFNNQPIRRDQHVPCCCVERRFHIDAQNGSRAAGLSMAALNIGWE